MHPPLALRCCLPLALCLVAPAFVFAAKPAEAAKPPSAEELDFFESRIRPVLIQHCYECHSNEKNSIKGNLQLDHRQGLLDGGDSGPAIVPGKPDESLLIEALKYESLEMPPAGRLPDNIIHDFEKWVRMGAPDPRVAKSANTHKAPSPDQAQEFWAFQQPVRHATPKVKDSAWAETWVDRFILARLEEAELEPRGDVDRQRLLRRLTFDLTGLPPTPEQLEAFCKDDAPDALARWVDALLDSPQYGEHWARHWLDVARYADSNGGDFNATFHEAWRYRNYVIDAFNSDKPYDVFVREQLAGDLLEAASDEQRTEQVVATGFLMLGAKMLSERDKLKLRMDVVDEQVDTLGRAMLGLTLGCARCHDHKFDPIPTADYYALAGVFRNTCTLEGEFAQYVSKWVDQPLPTSPEHAQALAEYEQNRKQLVSQMAEKKKQLTRMEQEMASADGGDSAAPPAMREHLDQMRKEMKQLESAMKELDSKAPPPAPTAMAVREEPVIEDSPIYIRGETQNVGRIVPRGFIRVASFDESIEFPADESGRRQVADWVADPRNPLTSRVMVNRIWYHLMGEGLVRTVDNFGALGEPPTHPELLDRLAIEFVESGWSVKHVVRLIVLSHVYRQSTDYDETAWNRDAENRLYWRAHRRRIQAESLRDAMLAACGELDLRQGESPVKSFDRMVTTNSSNDDSAIQADGGNYRTVYLPVLRNELPSLLTAFDFADPDLVTGKRPQTNVPSQALLLLNSPFVKECAQKTAARLDQLPSADETARVTYVYRAVLGRDPRADEVTRSLRYVEGRGPEAWAELVHALFASTEFRLLD